MVKNLLKYLLILVAFTTTVLAQTKVSGVVLDKQNKPIPFANIAFKNSSEGVVSSEDGVFYLESPKNYKTIIITSVGFSDKEIDLEKAINYKLKIQLKEIETLNEVVIYRGKTSKKNNPALDILRKIWERKRKNGPKTACICSISTKWKSTKKLSLI